VIEWRDRGLVLAVRPHAETAVILELLTAAHGRHLGIVLGRKGETTKAVGQAARAELEAFLGHRVHLFLTVKVRPNWLEEAERYEAIGLDFKDG
jgi:GTP-binding protein Era